MSADETKNAIASARNSTELELEPVTSEDEDYESSPPSYDITTYPADFTLEVLNQKWRQDEILIPDFQRRFVWKQNQASKLIESFLVGLPVPSVFFYSEREAHKYLVIDGQQRLKSIFYYFEGYFGDESKGKRSIFKLKGLNPDSPFYEKSFDELNKEAQLKLKNSVLRAFIVKQLDPEDDTSKFHIFERLNTGGTLLANQEIRNCVYHGNLIDALKKMNNYENWRKILGKNEPDSRGKDIELLVRFFAMRDITSYRKPLKEFLNKFMQKHRDAPQEKLSETQQIFEKTCDEVLIKLGERPFHIRSGLNTAVFDAVLTSFSNNLERIPRNVNDRYKKLIVDQKFSEYTQSGTTDVEYIRGRFSLAGEYLFDRKVKV